MLSWPPGQPTVRDCPTHIEVLGAVKVLARVAALVAAVRAIRDAIAQAGRAGHTADPTGALGLQGKPGRWREDAKVSGWKWESVQRVERKAVRQTVMLGTIIVQQCSHILRCV